MKNRGTMTRAALVMAGALLAGALLAGCSMDRWVEVESGAYVVAPESGATGTAARQEIQGLEIDREAGQMVFRLADGSEVVSAFVARDRAAWPAGCPTNIQSTRMEVLKIAEEPLNLGSTRFDRAVLVRDCPGEPVRLVLREDGEIGGGGTACPYGEQCLHFAPEPEAMASAEPLPHSPKGYELYSWKGNQGWQYALMTGTNRLKTYEEIVSGTWVPAENTVTGSEWVSLAVHGAEELAAVLSRLPQGETVSWRGAGWLEQAGVQKGNLQLPGPQVMEEVERTCRELGIGLEVAE